MRLANWGKVIGIAVLVMASAALAAELNKVSVDTYRFRYKTIVEVETPEGVKTGSAVREATVKKPNPEIQGYYDTQAQTKGEAVVVDLGERGVVFALTSVDDYQVVFDSFPGPPGLTAEGLRYYSGLKDAKATLKPAQYPLFVTFRDLSDPKSVLNLRETSGCFKQDRNGTCIREGFHVTNDRFEGFFGKGVKIKSITIEMTDAPVTWGIEKHLEWLKTVKMSYLSGRHINGPSLYEQLHGGNFQVGEK